ncbi:MAG TPA: tyrosine-type recombinase/integrase [Gemmatimonadales bacterium]|nr:tyrosine-type recombinase/integrase [Gemmatimonadales bacterium]
MASRKQRKKLWSYSAGERGRNRVRAYEDPKTGALLIEWWERQPGTTTLKRKRRSAQTEDRTVAKRQADELAHAFGAHEVRPSAEATLQTLFDIYSVEVSAQKGESKRQHDRRTAEMFLRYFGPGKMAKTLNRRDWDAFIADRRTGKVRPTSVKKARAVSDRQVGYDLQFLLSVLNWAASARNATGTFLLEANPLRGLRIPKNESPKRQVVTDEQYEALRGAAEQVGSLFGLALVVAHETGHRIQSIRLLRWSDVDLERGMIRWRAENDKIGFEHSTPLSSEIMAALQQQRAKTMAIGDAWVFPSPADPSKPCSRHLLRDWWERGAKLAGLPSGERYGWHSLRRKFATDMKDAPLRDLTYMGGWKNSQTLLTCYQQPDEERQREALANRTRRRASGGS